MQYRRLLITLLTLLSGFALYGLAQAQPIPLPLDPAQGRAAVELLTNAGFENDSDGDGVPDQWTGKNTDVASTDKQKCNKPEKVISNTGDCAFMFKGNVDGETAKLQQSIPTTTALVNGSTLTLNAFVDARSGAADSKIATAKVKLSDDSKLKLELRLPVNADEGYQLLTDSLEITLSSGITITEVDVDLRYDGTSGKFFIDDASLTVATEDGPTPTPTETVPPLPPVKLLASDGTAQDYFGYSVSLSADGSTALIGSEYHDVDGKDTQGAAYVYVRTGETWTQQQQLIADDGAIGDFFGASVSLSDDGNTAIVGAQRDANEMNTKQGSVYIFVRSGTTWTQQQKLVASDGLANAVFGASVSLSADGNTALIGAYGENIVALSPAEGRAPIQGAAYVFTRSGTTWTQQQKLQAADGTTDNGFGRSVSLNADATTAIIGAHKIGGGGMGPDQGAAYVFVNNAGTWTQQTKLTETEGNGYGGFGGSVSLSADGNTALVGYYGSNTGQPYMGSALVFARSGTTWTQQIILKADDGAANDYFGNSVSLSADGNTALIGLPGRDIATISRGAVYLYKRVSSSWILQPQYLADDGAANDFFGGAVSLSDDGGTALVGAFQDDIEMNTDQGSAWVFDLQ